MIKFKKYNFETQEEENDILINQHKVNFVDEYITPLRNCRRIWIAAPRTVYFVVKESMSEINDKLSGLTLLKFFGENDTPYLINIEQISGIEEIKPNCCRICFLSNTIIVDIMQSLEEVNKMINCETS